VPKPPGRPAARSRPWQQVGSPRRADGPTDRSPWP
jgi:hypothetical protein